MQPVIAYHQTNERELPQAELQRNPDGTTSINGYLIGPLLGRGGYAKVKLGTKNGKKYALKIASKGYLSKMKETYRDDKGDLKYRSALEKLYTEIEVLSKVDYPRIPKLYDMFEDEFEDKIYLVIQLAEKGVIADWDEEEQHFKIKIPHKDHLEEADLKRILGQLVDVLEYRKLRSTVHGHYIVHRDLKPQNLLLDTDDNLLLSKSLSIS
jgi:serine/threonine protein kinase